MTERRILEWLTDYDISEHGEIRRITPAQTRGQVPYQIMGSVTKLGYRKVKLMLPDGSKKSFFVAHLVCEAFHGPRPCSSMHCAHWDGDATNDSASNLRWATAKENVGDDRIRHGRTPKGERNGRAKLTYQQVNEARRMFSGRHGDIAKIARHFGISHSAMRSAINGEHWT